MKKIHWLILACILASARVFAQEQESERVLPSFTKIIASPRINVVLQKGDKESIRLTYYNVKPEQVNVSVSGSKLRIYLDRARIVEKQERINEDGNTHRRSIYHNSSVTAYVTYRQLKALEIRGEQEVSCNDNIEIEKLKLKAYGETEIDLAMLNVKKLKVVLYGRNHLTIVSGDATRQVYRLFGENKIDTRGMQSKTASTRIYGEGKLSLTASNEVVINAIGEPTIRVEGSPMINKGIVIGRVRIRH